MAFFRSGKYIRSKLVDHIKRDCNVHKTLLNIFGIGKVRYYLIIRELSGYSNAISIYLIPIILNEHDHLSFRPGK